MEKEYLNGESKLEALAVSFAKKEDLKGIVTLRNRLASSGTLSWLPSNEEVFECVDFSNTIVVKAEGEIIAYLLTIVPERSHTHTFLKEASGILDKPEIKYEKTSLSQICIHEKWHGKKIFEVMYEKLSQLNEFDYSIRFITIGDYNLRSLSAHKKKLPLISMGNFNGNEVFALVWGENIQLKNTLERVRAEILGNI